MVERAGSGRLVRVLQVQQNRTSRSVEQWRGTPTRCLLGGMTGLLVLASCTFVVKPQPYPPVSVPTKIDVPVALLIDDAQLCQVHSQGCLAAVGMAHTWRIETGMALRFGAEQTFRALFSRVAVISSLAQFDENTLILVVTPRISQFAIDQSLDARLFLECRLADRDGKVLYESTIPATGSGHSAAGCMMGVWGGEASLRENTNEAFNQAFVLLAADILNRSTSVPMSRSSRCPERKA